MTVRKSLIETHDTLILCQHADEFGDIFSLPPRGLEYVTLVAWGKASVEDHAQAPWETEAPAMVLFAPGQVIFEALTETLIVYCLFDKHAGPLEDVRRFVNRP